MTRQKHQRAHDGDPRTLGLIAGMGGLPAVVAADARSKGYRVVAVGLDGLSDGSENEYAEVSKSFNLGKINSVFQFFREHGVTEAVFAGKVPKTVLYDGSIRPDLRAAGILFRKLTDRRDDTIIGAVAREFESEGIRLRDMKDFCAGLLTPEAVLTRRRPDRREKKDIEFGLRMAKEIGRLDIGQTVVVKELAVMAVEAIEGTDEAIRRGGKLAVEGAVVVKVSRPNQDMRFDVPVVGIATLEAMAEVKASALALEASKSIIMDRENFLSFAQDAGIAVVGVTA